MEPPKKISKKAQLITGIGASSWFTIVVEKKKYRIERFSLEGKIECSGLFYAEPSTFDVKSEYKFTYLSHCKHCTIIQRGTKYNFHSYED
jgi:hypothetical protein